MNKRLNQIFNVNLYGGKSRVYVGTIFQQNDTTFSLETDN